MVIVILGILAAMAIPRFVNLQKDALRSSAKGELGALRAAAAVYFASTAVRGNARYPGTKADLTAQLTTPLEVLGTTQANSTWDWKYTSSLGKVEKSGW